MQNNFITFIHNSVTVIIFTRSLIDNPDIAVDCIVQAGQSMSSAKRRQVIKHLSSFLNDS